MYDTSGEEGLAAVTSIDERAEDIATRYASLDGEQLDYLSDTGQLIGGLLTAGDSNWQHGPLSSDEAPFFPDGDEDIQDACPRSIDQAIWNIQYHQDQSVRYYGLWWIYKFKVSEAEAALVNVLRTSTHQTTLGGYGLRRRAALALGAVASPTSQTCQDTVLALGDALGSSDYFLRYRAAEALSNIAQRCALLGGQRSWFPDIVVTRLVEILRKGRENLERQEELKSGYFRQESLFDLEALEPHVRAKIEKVFVDRQENEKRSRRTTMTPQLGVDKVGTEADEPFEWVLKAVSAICSLPGGVGDDSLTSVLQSYVQNPVPLVRYAAHKALYALTANDWHAEEIVQALRYGVEHHYSQRVLIRDLGDLGYSKGAGAVADCPMVENSFKILALKNMLAKRGHDAKDPDVRQVLKHMDSLL